MKWREYTGQPPIEKAKKYWVLFQNYDDQPLIAALAEYNFHDQQWDWCSDESAFLDRIKYYIPLPEDLSIGVYT